MAGPAHAHGSEYWFDRYASEILLYLSGAETIVDAGCGSGEILMRIAPRFKKVVAIDYSASMLEQARKRMAETGHAHVQLFCDNVTEIHKYCNERFDAIYCNGVIQYLDEVELDVFLQRAWKVLKPGGRLILLNVPNSNCRVLFMLGFYKHEKRVSFLRVLKGLPRLWLRMIGFAIQNRFRKYDDGIGNWFSIEMINTTALSHGFTSEIYGSAAVNYYYRFHAILTRNPDL